MFVSILKENLENYCLMRKCNHEHSLRSWTVFKNERGLTTNDNCNIKKLLQSDNSTKLETVKVGEKTNDNKKKPKLNCLELFVSGWMPGLGRHLKTPKQFIKNDTKSYQR